MSDNNGSSVHGVVLPFSDSHASQEQDTEQKFDGADILDRVSDFIRAYVHLSDEQAAIATVWTAHTHCVNCATTTPYLAINSAVKQSGKTRLLEVFELLVSKPWLTGRVTAACLVRKVDQVKPTLLLDESDAAFNGDKEYSEALRGILNTGFYAGGVASCCVGQGANITFRDFKTYCAKAIAGIGHLPDTVADRSIPIRLDRKKAGEVVARFRRRKAKEAASEIKTILSDWMSSIAPRLKEAEPVLPDEITDRQQDAIEPLLAIADQAGGCWPKAVRKAALAIFGSSAAADQNIGVQLLADIKGVFDEKGADRIFSEDLVTALAKIETSPWAEWKNGKPMTVIQLARQLKPFKAYPANVRIEDAQKKGYERDSFADAWSRYLTPVSAEPSQTDIRAVPSSHANVYAGQTDFCTRPKNCDGTTSKNEESPMFMRVGTAGTTQNAPRAGVDGNGAIFAMSSCPKCGSFAVYKEADGSQVCMTCEAARGIVH
jgi:Protein of unknown function (DUF3631)